jgi:hypothetical protein
MEVTLAYPKQKRLTSCLMLLVLSICSLTENSFAQSLKFNGTTQYGRVTNAPELKLQSFTIEMWIKPEATGTVSANGSGSGGVLNSIPLLSKGTAENEAAAIDVNYYLGIRSTDMKLGADFEDNVSSTNHPAFSNTAIQMCKWQHIAVTYDQPNGQWKIFINGALDNTVNLGTAFIPQNLSDVNLSLGSSVNSTNANAGYFNGKMDEIRIWNVVRTSTEINNNKNLEITSAPGLVARYGLNEGVNNIANNSATSVSNLNATLFNNPAWSNQFLVNSALDFDGVNDYVTFGTAAALGLANFTLEAWVKIEGPGVVHTSTGTGGLSNVIPIVTKGRDEADGTNVDMNYYMGIKSIGTNYNIVADFEEGSGAASPGLNHPLQGAINIPQNVWTHLACTYDGNDLKLYVNGQPDATLHVAQPVRSNSIQHAALGTAINSTGGTAGFFQGRMDEVRIWNSARSAAQIAANYALEIPSATGLVGRWDMNEACGVTNNTGSGSSLNGTVNGAIWVPINYNLSPLQPSAINPSNGQTSVAGDQVSVTVTDPEFQQMSVTLYGRPKPQAASAPNFTIIGLPDTQHYTEEPQGLSGAGGGHNGIFKAQTQWIRDHRVDSNIIFVIQLGDCTENGERNEIEWKRADTSIKFIENPSIPLPEGIPYSICVGNHDQGNAAGDPNATTNFYNQYFGTPRFTGRGYYGGHYGSNNDNHYELFSVGGINFIHISIEYNNNSGSANQTALQNVLNWADGLLKSYPNHKGILSSHWILGTGLPASFGGPGQKIYDELKDNPNLILLLSGHIHGEGRRSDIYNGSTVNTILSDYQDYPNGGNGFLRIMQFRPSENILSIKTYSPTINGGAGGFESDGDSQFTIPMNLTANPFAMVGVNNNVNSGSVTTFTWSGLQPLTTYEWFVTIDDGENVVTSNVFQFTTAGALPLTLLNFKATNETNSVQLEWSTSGEINTKQFDVERSLNASSFTAIGIEKSKNANGVQHYSLVDNKPLSGKSWYRLRMEDNDGNVKYSKSVVVNRSRTGKFDIVPNPSVHNEIRLVGIARTNDQVLIKVYDVSGRLQLQRNVMATGQDIVLQHHLLPGIYNLECITKAGKENKQIIVR